MELIKLGDGVAHHMGEGVFVICQPSDQGPQNVVVTLEDFKTLQRAARREPVSRSLAVAARITQRLRKWWEIKRWNGGNGVSLSAFGHG